MHKYLRMALDIASKNEYDDTLEYHLCAIIVRGGSIVSVGFNKRSHNSFVEHYMDVAKFGRDWCCSTHAEMDAVLRARGKSDLRGCKIFVARRRKRDGQPAMARPCEICQHVLYNYGIRRAYFTMDNESYGVMKVVNPAELFLSKNKDDQ